MKTAQEKEVKHTPGPWHVGIGNTNYCYFVGDDPNLSAEETKANARLISAAPDLLAACEACMEFWDNDGPVWAGAEVVADMREAIRKAKAKVE